MRHTTILIVMFASALVAQRPAEPRIETTSASVGYWDISPFDRVSELHRNLQKGTQSLAHDPEFGYLPAILKQLAVPIESQILVFSKTSLQSAHINPDSPRAIYFNDDVSVAWVRQGPILEVAAHDPQNGMMFYAISQAKQDPPRLVREQVCLDCHHTAATLGVPGNLVRTVFPGLSGLAVTGLAGSPVDHRTDYEERWGGWYVTGRSGPVRHRANAVVVSVSGEGPMTNSDRPAAPLREKFSTSSYLSPYSDIVALTVFEHQVHLTNLITRVSWESKIGELRQSTIHDLVDYMLFIEEAALPSPITGSSGFAASFERRGPADRQGRSLRMLDLKQRLMRYPCSYMIYSTAFQSLPSGAKAAIYARLFSILSGTENSQRYARLTEEDRKAVAEILRETLPDVSGF
jgi:hypothetical protein